MRKYEGLDRFVSLLFPKGCVLCGSAVAYDDLLCGNCEPDRPLDAEDVCAHCGKPAGSCVCPEGTHSGGWAFEGAISALLYRSKTRDAILRLKKAPDLRIARFLSGEMAGALRKRRPDFHFDLITEVPMHPDRLAKRGFNQAELLAAQVAPLLNVPHRMRLLACVDDTVHQHSLPREERFAVAKNRYTLQIRGVAGKHILLIDDVLTTGATADACADLLLEGGAASVFVLTAVGTIRKS